MESSSGTVSGATLVGQSALAAVLILLPLAIVIIRTLVDKSPFAPLSSSQDAEAIRKDTETIRETVSSVASSSLALAGLTFAGVSLLATGKSGLADAHQTPIGFFVLALFAYSTCVVCAKWINPWTIWLLEQLRDTGTVLLLLGVGLLIADFPGSTVWDVMAAFPIVVAGIFYLNDLWTTFNMAIARLHGVGGFHDEELSRTEELLVPILRAGMAVAELDWAHRMGASPSLSNEDRAWLDGLGLDYYGEVSIATLAAAHDAYLEMVDRSSEVLDGAGALTILGSLPRLVSEVREIPELA